MPTTYRKPSSRWLSRLSVGHLWPEAQPLPSAGPNTKARERPGQRPCMSHVSSLLQ